ncbi:hypothetical protein [Stratiformator vulcanicus]|uniref:Uncharacterized protein n=1 Tax=Stratiformator vulcanicus TaxID=2527980 RepID=A0A517QYI7_9PLAN|nr:hypothetical protein [Stratiformator vulcanicus]QDT36717.1 hypothetical protein Pan189_10800 [Stratiformator vulcanicus]
MSSRQPNGKGRGLLAAVLAALAVAVAIKFLAPKNDTSAIVPTAPVTVSNATRLPVVLPTTVAADDAQKEVPQSATAGHEVASAPAEPKIDRRNVPVDYFKRSAGPLPEPTAPPVTPLVPLTPEQIAEAERQIEDYLRQKLKTRRLPEVAIPLGQVANAWNADDEFGRAKNRRERYFLIARHLSVVTQLLAQDEIEVRRSGLKLASRVLSKAAFDLKDGKLAAAIADAFIVPHLDAAHPMIDQYDSRYHMLRMAVVGYGAGDQPEKMEGAIGEILKLLAGRNAADAWRLTLAKSLRKQGKETQAIAVLADIHDPSIVPAKEQLLASIQDTD